MSTNSSNGSSSDSSLSITRKRPDRKKKRQKSNHHAAPSDYAQLHQHFQFVLPENAIDNTKEKYGSTWQERMVKHFHSHCEFKRCLALYYEMRGILHVFLIIPALLSLTDTAVSLTSSVGISQCTKNTSWRI